MKDLQVWLKLVEHLPRGERQQLKVTGVNPNVIVGCAGRMSRDRSAQPLQWHREQGCEGGSPRFSTLGSQEVGFVESLPSDIEPPSLLRVAGMGVPENVRHTSCGFLHLTCGSGCLCG